MNDRNHNALWLVLLAAAGTFALTMGIAPRPWACSCRRSTPRPAWDWPASAWLFAFGQLLWG